MDLRCTGCSVDGYTWLAVYGSFYAGLVNVIGYSKKKSGGNPLRGASQLRGRYGSNSCGAM